jgi:hypothetical protein
MKQVSVRILIAWIVLIQSVVAQTTFHDNIARTGVYGSPGPKQFNGMKWAFKTEGPITGSPAIVAGVVFIGSLDNHLYAIDQQTGQPKWKFKTGGPIASSPAVNWLRCRWAVEQGVGRYHGRIQSVINELEINHCPLLISIIGQEKFLSCPDQ